MQSRRHHWRGRVGSHAAGIRALVAVLQALVVLARGQRQRVRAVCHDDEARFLAFEEFLDHDARAGFAQPVLHQHQVYRGPCLGYRGRNHNPFAGGKAVGLDHDRRALLVDVSLGFACIRERRIFCGRQAMTHHELLGEILRGLELRCSAHRTEDFQARLLERVHDAGGERRFGTDDSEIDLFFFCEADQFRNGGNPDILQSIFGRRAAIARCYIHLLHLRALRQLPGHRVLAPAGSDDKEFHVSGGSAARR
jgi:hypothetical protein